LPRLLMLMRVLAAPMVANPNPESPPAR